MFLTSLVVSSAFGASWEKFGDREWVLTDAEYTLEVPTNHVNYNQVDKALGMTDMGKVGDGRHYHAKKNDTCWHFHRPDACPHGGFIKFEQANLHHVKVGHAQIALGKDNKASMVIANVTMKIPKTKFTTQANHPFSWACDGHITGLIHGAAAAVEGIVDMAADGVPILGEASAEPIDGAIVEIERTLDGLCGLVEHVLGALIGLLGDVLHVLLGTIIPDLVSAILNEVLQVAGTIADPGVKLATRLAME